MPHWNAIALCAARESCNGGRSYRTSIEFSWLEGDDYVSKALVGIIFGRILAKCGACYYLLVSYRTLAG